MNDTVLEMKQMRRAMNPFVLTLYEIILESKPEKVLEIGVRQGQSTRVILSALEENKKGILYSIDLGDRGDRIPEHLKKYWEPIIGNSCKIEWKESVDILLIDGDHSYEGVKRDFEKYSVFVNKYGTILMHDIINENCGVPKFWKEIKYNKIALNYGVAGMGIIQI